MKWFLDATRIEHSAPLAEYLRAHSAVQPRKQEISHPLFGAGQIRLNSEQTFSDKLALGSLVRVDFPDPTKSGAYVASFLKAGA